MGALARSALLAGLRIPSIIAAGLALTALATSADAQSRRSAPVATRAAVGDAQTAPQGAAFSALLDDEKEDTQKLDALRASANAKPPGGASTAGLAAFHLQRSSARALLGRQAEAIADAETALRLERTGPQGFAAKLSLAWLLFQNQDQRKALVLFTQIEREADRPGVKGWVFAARRGVATAALALGEQRRAEQAYAAQRAMLQEARGWPPFAEFGDRWMANVEATAVALNFADQEFERAEASARRAEQLFRRGARARSLTTEERETFLRSADLMLAAQARAKFNQGRLAEAETDYRTAVISRVRAGGRSQLQVADFLAGLQHVKFLQAQYAEALKLSDRVAQIATALEVPKSSRRWVRHLNNRAWLLSRLNRREEVDQIYAQVDDATDGWSEPYKQMARTPPHRLSWMINTRRSDEGIAVARQALERTSARLGDDHVTTALSRIYYAAMLARTGQLAESLPEFRKAMPVILDNEAEERDDIDVGGTSGLDQTIRYSIGQYLFAISRHAERTRADVEDAFRYMERVRGDSLQRALLAASARASLATPQLAALVRREQDAEKQIAANVDALRSAIALPPDQRDPKTIESLRAEVAKGRRDRTAIRAELARRAPKYAELMRPEPPTIAQVQSVLQPGEVYVSILVGEIGTNVLAVPKEGEPRFVGAPIGRVRVGELVTRVRSGLDLQGATLLDIPAFDVEAAAALYQEILKPVEETLDTGSKLLIAANGPIAGLPFGLLARQAPQLDYAAEPMFEAHRRVPWLIRTHSITMLPSAATLRSLRTASGGAPARQPFIGFGDPLFAKDQIDGAPHDSPALEELPTRGGRRNARLAFRNLPKVEGVDMASFGQLQRLPDTAEELTSIAVALKADPARSVVLQRDANERRVKDTNLAGYRVVAFATHGLTPGELPGLRLPALALTAPDIAGVAGDGLLAIDEVLQLRLDADWVVLSACNTGSGLGEGAAAEAATGLARAFFFAGSRALLVTGWAVHSASARDLVSDVFKRQSENAGVGRAEALQRAMIHLLDEGAIKDPSGGVVATYAHPVFWAPYILLGEGGPAR